MSRIFDNLIANPNDKGGWGEWLNLHYLDHLQIQQKAMVAAASGALGDANKRGVSIPLYDIALWTPTLKEWAPAHEEMHSALGNALNVQVNDLSEVDWEDPSSWSMFLALNGADHAAFWSVLGI